MMDLMNRHAQTKDSDDMSGARRSLKLRGCLPSPLLYLCDYMNKKNQASRAQEIATQELGLCWVGQDGF